MSNEVVYKKITLPYLQEKNVSEKNPLSITNKAGKELGISKESIQFHYGKHHTTYVTNLNNFALGTNGVKQLPYFEKNNTPSLDHIVKTIEPIGDNAKIFNNAAQIWNHDFYWQSLAEPESNNVGDNTVPPPRDLKKLKNGEELFNAIEKSFTTYKEFKDKFTTAATSHFGSGWAWLIYKEDGTLDVVGSHDAANPLNRFSMKDVGVPLLTCDVWEHAYYIDYRNVRADYVNAWWALVNWEFAIKNYQEAKDARDKHLANK